MFFWIGKRGCGHSDLDSFGVVRVIKIQSIFIVGLQRGIEKIRLWESKMGRSHGKLNQMK